MTGPLRALAGPPAAAPDKAEFDALPKNSTGKGLKTEVRKLL
ncbi:MAG TPA: hypothetical protein VMV91_17995 [Rhodocyclaceae bacterium]|nr:hypothetical protein [Rhodocyclaceae bacterium]